MKAFKKTLCIAAAIATTLLPLSAATAQDIKSRTIKFAFQNQGEHPQAQGAKKFADLVAAKSGDKMKVRTYAGGILGGDLQTVSALQGGTVEMTVLNAGILSAQVKEFAAFDLPFLFSSAAEADAVTDGAFGKGLLAKLHDKNLIGLGYWDLGFRHLTNSKHAVAKLEDVSGLKIRVIQSPIYIDLFNTLGANAPPLPFPELYGAPEQKAADGPAHPASRRNARRPTLPDPGRSRRRCGVGASRARSRGAPEASRASEAAAGIGGRDPASPRPRRRHDTSEPRTG